MNRNKKIAAIVGVTSLATVAVIGGALALFTDSADKNVNGLAGTVDIVATDLTLSNPDNINPGDFDPEMPVKYTPTEGDPLYDPEDPTKEVVISTTPHNLTFSITNNGTKSIRTRHTLVLSVKDTEDNYLDARVFQLYEDLDGALTDMPGADEELPGKIYIANDADSTEYTNESDIPEDTLIKAIVYRFTPDIFDGVGTQAETETNSTVKGDGETPATKAYDYKLALNMDTPNSYQGSTLAIEATFEALQYRNTVQNDWTVVSKKTFTASVATSNMDVVPERTED